MGIRVRRLWTLLGTVSLIAIAATAAAQIWAGGYGRTPPRFPTATTFSGGFNFCRVMFTSDHREKQGWSTDYPGADINFSIRVVRAHQNQRDDAGRLERRCPSPMPSSCASRTMRCSSARSSSWRMPARCGSRRPKSRALQDYLLKGGFLLVADYHGSWAQEQFDEEIARVLPPGRYPTIDLTPPLTRSSDLAHDVQRHAAAADGVDQHLAPHRRCHRALERKRRAAGCARHRRRRRAA